MMGAVLSSVPQARTPSSTNPRSSTLHYNPSCPDCVRQAKRTARLDWLRAIELRTDRSPLGEVPVGEIVIVDEHSCRVFTGVYAIRMVCLRIPLLTKVNWKSTQFDQKLLAPIKAPREVGRVLKHVPFGSAVSPDFRKYT